MFTTVENVKEMTGYDVDAPSIMRAQVILESVTGKVEAEVSDANDLAIMGRATAFQVAYMANNYDKVYEQVAFTYKGQSDAAISLDANLMSPFIAPLAVFAMRRLSWVHSRSVKVGSLYGKTAQVAWEVD
jgi:hypothetical protein